MSDDEVRNLCNHAWYHHRCGRSQFALNLLAERFDAKKFSPCNVAIAETRASILIGVGRFRDSREELCDFMGVEWEPHRMKVRSPSKPLMEVLYNSIMLDPDLAIDDFQGILWWLLGDAVDTGHFEEALCYAGQLIAFLNCSEPELARVMAIAWLPEAEKSNDPGHREALSGILQELRNVEE